MKKIAASLLIGILITTSASGFGENISEELGENIVRLHIVANSDSSLDQEVKLKVRDALLSVMEDCTNEEMVGNCLNTMENVANMVLEEAGFSYKATAELGKFDFPTKYYDGFALPKGRYRAVRIRLGEAKGENWWCVLFPPLCMVDAATGERDELLKETFGENYSVVADGERPGFNIKFKLAEIF